jgi:hypothetical protein
LRTPALGEFTTSTTRGSAHSKYAGLLPIEPSDEFARPADLKKDQSSLGRQALRTLAQFLVTLFVFLAAMLAWLSYGNIAGHMTADLHRQLGFALPSRKLPDATALTTSVAPYPAQQRPDADRIASGQEQMTRETDQTATGVTQAASAQTDGIPVESRGDAASLQPTVRLKPTEAKRPQTLSEKGKPLSAASGHDASCFPTASAVLQNHPGGWPTWTLRAPGHEGAMCWYAAARPREGTIGLPEIDALAPRPKPRRVRWRHNLHCARPHTREALPYPDG